MVDFGRDMTVAIVMFEKPMGIWAILKSFEEKLKALPGEAPCLPEASIKDRQENCLCHLPLPWHRGLQCDQLAGEERGLR